MYRKFDVTGNLLFAQYFFFEEVNTAIEAFACDFLCHFMPNLSTAVFRSRKQRLDSGKVATVFGTL
jgi:hypothetical protein